MKPKSCILFAPKVECLSTESRNIACHEIPGPRKVAALLYATDQNKKDVESYLDLMNVYRLKRSSLRDFPQHL